MDIVTYILCKKYAQSYTDEQIKVVSKGMTFKGSVPTLDDLPLEGNALGDLYIIEATNDEYVWASELSSGTIENWQQLGKTDLSNFYTKAEVDEIKGGLTSEINNLKSTKVNSTTFNSTVVDLRSSDATLGEAIDSVKSTKQDKINDLADIRAGAALGKTAIQEHQDISGKQDKLSVDTREDYTGIILNNNKVGINHEIIATNDYVDANITDTMNFIIQERDNEHAGRVAGDNLLQEQINNKQATIEDLADIRSGAALGATAIQEHQDISHLATKVELAEKQDLLKVNEENATAELSSLTINDTIYKIAGEAKIGKTFTTKVTVGKLEAGTAISSDMKIADILYNILFGQPVEELMAYYYEGATMPETIDADWTSEAITGEVKTTGLVHRFAGGYKGYIAFAYPKTLGTLVSIYQNDFPANILADSFILPPIEVTYNNTTYYMYKVFEYAKINANDKYELNWK